MKGYYVYSDITYIGGGKEQYFETIHHSQLHFLAEMKFTDSNKIFLIICRKEMYIYMIQKSCSAVVKK